MGKVFKALAKSDEGNERTDIEVAPRDEIISAVGLEAEEKKITVCF